MLWVWMIECCFWSLDRGALHGLGDGWIGCSVMVWDGMIWYGAWC
jgi:hypothetical protein